MVLLYFCHAWSSSVLESSRTFSWEMYISVYLLHSRPIDGIYFQGIILLVQGADKADSTVRCDLALLQLCKQVLKQLPWTPM